MNSAFSRCRPQVCSTSVCCSTLSHTPRHGNIAVTRTAIVLVLVQPCVNPPTIQLTSYNAPRHNPNHFLTQLLATQLTTFPTTLLLVSLHLPHASRPATMQRTVVKRHYTTRHSDPPSLQRSFDCAGQPSQGARSTGATPVHLPEVLSTPAMTTETSCTGVLHRPRSPSSDTSSRPHSRNWGRPSGSNSGGDAFDADVGGASRGRVLYFSTSNSSNVARTLFTVTH